MAVRFTFNIPPSVADPVRWLDELAGDLLVVNLVAALEWGILEDGSAHIDVANVDDPNAYAALWTRDIKPDRTEYEL
ncbi:MAG TPA: hypothetical protein VHQ86_04450 [Candidatus Saccharimonadia bacterium]|jgi:hypothetical protein|nr:hypothetical protein [Candidatus Saccharimonadia bacterium]